MTTRRTFIKSVAITSAIAVPASAYGRILGSNDKIRVAVVGVNSRGRNHVEQMSENVVALCDCDKKVLEERASQYSAKFSRSLVTEIDFRKLCERKDIDAVSIATPNHTHSLIGITAAANGKDVYCEKPVSHNVWEGRQLANASRKYNRIIQCGTQSRSSTAIRDAVRFVRSGKLGKINYVVGTCYKPRKGIGKLDRPLQIPENIDYDLWCGPAEKRELFRPKLHYDWHWDFNTGNGDMGNQGIHQMDIARWFLGEDKIAPRSFSIGARVGYVDAGNTPNTQTVLHDYAEAPLVFETRGLPKSREFQEKGWGENMDRYHGSRVGVVIHCEDGHVLVPSYSAATAYDGDGDEVQKWAGGGNHYQNFLDAVRDRRPTMLNAEIVEGHLSSALCHTGNLSHQHGRPATIEEIRETTAAHEPFAASVERMLEHLKANAVDISGQALTLGADLTFDPESESVTNNQAANSATTRDYRAGFEVPDLA